MEPPTRQPPFAAAATPRTPSQERRARKRRAEARVRLRLAADHKLLADHHASQPPSAHMPHSCRSSRVELLLEAMLAQQQALFMCISGLYGWQAGLRGDAFSHGAAEAPQADVPSGQGQAAEFVGGSQTAADGACISVGARDVDHRASFAHGDARVQKGHSGYTFPSKVDSSPVQADGMSCSDVASFNIADVVDGVDPVLFERSRRYFGSAGDHRVAFDDVAGNLQNELVQPPCSLYPKGALLDFVAFGKLVSDGQLPFRLISGVQERWMKLVASHDLECVSDLRTQEDLLAHLLQEPDGVNLSGLSLGSLYVVALFTFAGFPAQYNLESYVDLLRLVPGGLQTSFSSFSSPRP